MTDALKEKLNRLPEEPGVYKMLDANGRIIYIGKSKCLKKRVHSYFVPNPKWEKAQKMVPYIQDIAIETCDTHLEAMLLECELIKTIRPFFNVLMKDDQRYIYLKIEEYPAKKPLSITYQREENSYGPFRSKSALQRIFDFMEHFYPLQKVKNSFLFEYHFFPLKMDRKAFEQNRKVLYQILREDKAEEAFLRKVRRRMKEAAAAYQFEMAAAYRNLSKIIPFLAKNMDSYQDKNNRMIFLDLEIKQGHKWFFIAHGCIIHKKVAQVGSAEEKEAFICEGKAKSAIFTLPFDEKGLIDYRNILYSGLSEGYTEILH